MLNSTLNLELTVASEFDIKFMLRMKSIIDQYCCYMGRIGLQSLHALSHTHTRTHKVMSVAVTKCMRAMPKVSPLLAKQSRALIQFVSNVTYGSFH